MKLAIVKVRIDKAHAAKLLSGSRVTIMVPRGAEAITLQLEMPVSTSYDEAAAFGLVPEDFALDSRRKIYRAMS
jgi:hypothetical protein